jgi:hypothetical protein
MPTEIFVFLGVVFVVVVFVLWRSRRGGDGDGLTLPVSDADRPEPAISNESSLAPHRNLGRPWRAESGERPSDGDGI